MQKYFILKEQEQIAEYFGLSFNDWDRLAIPEKDKLKEVYLQKNRL